MRCDIAAIIVNYNTRELLRECIRSLSEKAEARPAEIVVVDNGSSDGSAEMVEELIAGQTGSGGAAGAGEGAPGEGGAAGDDGPTEVKLVRMGGNPGYSTAVEAGVEASSAGKIFILSSDVEVVGRCLPTLGARLDGDAKAGLVAPMQLTPPRGKLLRSWFKEPGPLRQLSSVFLIDLLRSRFDVRLPSPVAFEADWVMGAAMMLRREDHLRAGGMDTSMFMYGEDYDLCRRIRGLGLRVEVVPEAVVMHHMNASAAKAFSHHRLAYSNAGLLLAYRKHHGAASAGAYRAALFADSLVKAAAARLVSLLPVPGREWLRNEMAEHLFALRALRDPGLLRRPADGGDRRSGG